MYRDHTVGVIVPAYDEAERIGHVLESIPAFVDRVYAVDDCSTDRTWDVIQRYATADPDCSAVNRDEAVADETVTDAVASGREVSPPESLPDGGTLADPQVVPIRHEENQGAGGALRTGYRRARADGVDLTVTIDADGQMDPERMPALLDPLVEDEADYAKGNRLANREDWMEMPPFRTVGNWLLTALTKVASGYWRTTDPQNGYTAITREALCAIDVDRMRDNHDYCNDLLVRLNVADMRVVDVSMPAVYRDEESTIDFASFVPTTSLTLARGFGWRLKECYLDDGVHPVAVCYGVGVLGAVIGVVTGLTAVVESLTSDSAGGRAAKSAVALAVSLFLVVTAMVLDATANEGLEVTRE
ncbi:glycosyltransferase family 2 protein [Halostella sp. PRR32]|uniref:glycosyltransferase family 2 protein n=1 Tax=Halostella sp. PRR32 TaxID=3098147 RepID=UPI002B1DECB0|nr:glycosyltransferase family 2 protein [Halostella sp. PRR32]